MKKETISYIMLFVIAISSSILTSSIWTLILILGLFGIIFGIAKVIKICKNNDEKGIKAREIVCLVASILSIFFGTIWYLALILSIVPLVLSIKRIRKNGSTIAKVTTSFSIVGIVNCVFWYVTAIMNIIIAY